MQFKLNSVLATVILTASIGYGSIAHAATPPAPDAPSNSIGDGMMSGGAMGMSGHSTKSGQNMGGGMMDMMAMTNMMNACTNMMASMTNMMNMMSSTTMHGGGMMQPAAPAQKTHG